MASTPIDATTDPAGGGAAGVETSGTAEASAAPTSRSVFFFTALFAFRPDAQDYTKARPGSCDITVCKLSIFCLIFVSEISRNQYNEPIVAALVAAVWIASILANPVTVMYSITHLPAKPFPSETKYIPRYFEAVFPLSFRFLFTLRKFFPSKGSISKGQLPPVSPR